MRTPPAVLALRVIGLAGLLLLVLGGAGSLAVGFFEQRSSRTAAVEGVVAALDVTALSGDVTVEAAAADGPTTVTAGRMWTLTPPATTQVLEAGTLRLRDTCRAVWSVMQPCSVDWTVVLPAGAAVTVRTSTGNVQVDALAGRVMVRTGAGDVRLDGVRSADVRVQTGAGDARLDFAATPDTIVTTTGAGDVEVRLPADGTAYRVVGSSAVGDRTVSVPESSASRHVLDLTTGVGEVDVAFGDSPVVG